MRVLGAYMLAVLGGTEKPTEEDITKILDSIGEKPDGERVKLFLSQIEGKDLKDVIEAGSKKLGTMGGPAGGPGATADGAAGEEKKEEKKEEEEDDGGIDFSDDDE
mmetsp:Transcript_15491/g.18667  ORF Transcript_15491/g.18667 Transcript_15491/m.18667 type:complete len:106 (-) Transcript_15491:124-441(-)